MGWERGPGARRSETIAMTVVVIVIVAGSTALCVMAIMAELANSVKYYCLALRVRNNQTKNIKLAKARLAKSMAGPAQLMYAAASAAQVDGKPARRRNTVALARSYTAVPVDEEAARVRVQRACASLHAPRGSRCWRCPAASQPDLRTRFWTFLENMRAFSQVSVCACACVRVSACWCAYVCACARACACVRVSAC